MNMSSTSGAIFPPKRIISVLPSATEILCLLPTGASLLVGRSHECDFPKTVADRPILTSQKTHFTTSADVDKQVSEALSQGNSLYNLEIETIKSLRPDLWLTQDICQVCAIDLQTVERVAATMHPRPTVLTLNPNSLHDVLQNVLDVGRAVGQDAAAREVYNGLLARLRAIEDWTKAHVTTRPNVAMIEWVDPIFFGGHWTPQLIELAGGYHPLNTILRDANDMPDVVAGWDQWAYGASPYTKSFRIPTETLVASRPEVLLIAPCGLDIPTTKRELRIVLARDDAWWWQLSPRPKRVMLVDGNHHFNRPGPRLVDAAEFVLAMLHRPEQLGAMRDAGVVGFEELDLDVWFDRNRFVGKSQEEIDAACKADADA
ncbi:hypothetical protein H9P43_005640 [Blastocladiella emersonii ATCC 22665]|nr:hypothetical protein H9P43_005640 [Blastocladiella emersonii ATCC 22665]